ncbi:MAG: hypothetical protein ABF247_08275 [Nonlabens sp.]|uniref:hypothetical protein n=1 Tax=Nonlabens sp. TaxID=1888209 RepID=UPI00321BC285
MKVNKQQIEQLFRFTRKHYVEWYDLQSELVDHLANGIEQQWKKFPSRSFEDALQVEFKKFGIFGFMEVVEERQKSLGKKYTRIIWSHIVGFFKLPKILLLGLLTALTYYLLSNTDLSNEYYSMGMIVMFVSYFIFLSVKNYRNRKAKQKSGEKKWLFEEIISQHGSGFGIGFLPIYLFNIFIPNRTNFTELHPYLLVTISFLFVLLCIMIYVMLVEIPKKAQDYIEDTYPEYKLVD